MANKKNPFDVLAEKQAKKAKEAARVAKEQEAELKAIEAKEKEVKAPPVKKVKASKGANRVKSSNSKKDSNGGRKLIRVHNEIHELARFNEQHMQLSDYVEALIQIANNGGADWSKFSKEELERMEHEGEEKRTLFRILPDFHRMVRFNKQKMQVQNYIEALVLLDKVGAIDWSLKS